MRIGIIGAGSIGMLFAGLLSSQHEMTLYCKSEEQALDIMSKGLTVESSEGRFTNRVLAKPSYQGVGDEELILVVVKQYQLYDIIPLLKNINLNIPLIFLQNGMGHLNYIRELDHLTIFLGVVEHGAMRLETHTVLQTGKGLTRMALFRGNMDPQFLIEQLHQEQFPFKLETDYLKMIHKKLVVNAVINPLTGLLRIPNGQLLENKSFYKLAQSTFNEVALVLELSDQEDYFQSFIAICEKTAKNTSSLLKDLENNRKTEIDGILGVLLEMANQKQLKVPTLQFLYESIKGLELMRGNQ